MKGFVYILSNPSMPGLVKIGRTVRTVEGRAVELYQTGVPTPFVIEHSVLSPDCAELEQIMHDSLEAYRIAAGREFFRCDTAAAMRVLDDAIQEQVTCFVSEYLEGFYLVHELDFVDPGDLAWICNEAGVRTYEFAQSLTLIDPIAVQEAVAEYHTKRVARGAVVVDF